MRREVLIAKLAAADEPPPLLHPKMARICRTKVTELAKAFQEPKSRVEATEALRGLVDAIVLTPAAGGQELGIELRGNLAAMLGPPYKARGRQKPATSRCKFKVVAGARNPLNLEFASAAA